MAEKPISEKTDLISWKVFVGGEEIPGTMEIVEIEVVKELNRIASAKLVIYDGSPSSENFGISEGATFLPGNEVEINVGHKQDNATIFKGIVVSHGIRSKPNEKSALIVKCNDLAAKMTVTRKNVYFLEKTDSDIITEVLGKYSDLTPKVDDTSYSHKEVIQYNSTDWDFVLSRAEENGLVVVTSDNEISVVKPDFKTKADVSLLFGSTILKTDLEIDARTQLPMVNTHAWDLSGNELVSAAAEEPEGLNEQGNLDGPTLAGTLAPESIDFHSSAPLEDDNLQAWADARLLRSRMARIRGSIKFVGSPNVKPNMVLTIEGLGARFNGDAYVSGVVHKIVEGLYTTEAIVGLSPKIFTETQTDIMMPAGSGLLPGIEGLHIGVVQQIDSDPDGESRVLVHIPTILESEDGVWARLTTHYGTAEAGSFWYPEIDDEVILGFLNNDPRYPIILGSVYGKTHEPPYVPDSDNTYKALVTNGQLKLEFEDVKKIITIVTPNGNTMIFSDDEGSITIEDENQNIMVMDSAGISFETPKDFNIKATGNVNIEASQNISIKASMDVSVEGLNVSSKAQVGITNEGVTAELKGSAQTTVKGGIVMIN